MRDSRQLREAEEAIISTFEAVAKCNGHDPAAKAQIVNRLLPHDLRAKYLQMYSQFHAAMQHISFGFLLNMEGCCLHISQRPEAALEAFKKGIAVMDWVIGRGTMERKMHLWRIVGTSMACGYQAEARKVLAEIWEDYLAQDTNLNLSRRQFIDFTCTFALPWWQGSTSICIDDFTKMHVLHSMAQEVTRPIKRNG